MRKDKNAFDTYSSFEVQHLLEIIIYTRIFQISKLMVITQCILLRKRELIVQILTKRIITLLQAVSMVSLTYLTNRNKR